MAALTDGTTTLPQATTDFVQPVGSKYSTPGYAAPAAPVNPATAFSSVSGQKVLDSKQATAAKLTPGGVPSYMQNLSPDQYTKITGKALPTPLTAEQLAAQNNKTAASSKVTAPSTPPPGWDQATYAAFKAANPSLEPTSEDTARMQAAGSSTPSNVTFVNKDTGQEYTLNNATPDQIKSFQDSGWDMAEGAGSGAGVIPSTPIDPQVKAAQDAVASATADRDAAVAKLTKFDVSSDPELQGSLSAITNDWNSRIQQMQQVNNSRVQNVTTLGIRNGDRYTGGSGGMFGSIITAEETASANRIGELQGEKQAALVSAKQAYESQKWTEYSKLVDLAESKYQDQVSEMRDLQTRATAATKALNDQIEQQKTDYYNQVQKPVNDIATEAAKNGLNDPKTLAAIQGAKDVGTAISLAGDYLQTGTGQMGDYLQYKRDALTKGLTPNDYETWKTADDAKQEALKSKEAYDTAYATASAKDQFTNSSATQDKLEQQYRQVILKELSNRSGGLGLQDQKVNQAIHLKALYDQYKTTDASGNTVYNIPTAQYSELVFGLANLLSASGTTAESDRKQLMSMTAAGNLKGALQYITGTPQNGNTQAIIGNLIDSINRQGTVAEELRNNYVDNLHGLVPTDLDPSRATSLEQSTLASFTNNPKDSVDTYVKSNPDKSENIAKLYDIPGTTDQDVWEYIQQMDPNASSDSNSDNAAAAPLPGSSSGGAWKAGGGLPF